MKSKYTQTMARRYQELKISGTPRDVIQKELEHEFKVKVPIGSFHYLTKKLKRKPAAKKEKKTQDLKILSSIANEVVSFDGFTTEQKIKVITWAYQRFK
jgi:hypothetical protein